MTVTLLERDAPAQGTSRVAAGMLAPVAEVEFGEAGAARCSSWVCARPRCGRRSPPSWRRAPVRRSACCAPARCCSARDDDDARELERQLDFRRSLGLAVRRLRPSQARELEPALAPTVRLALEAPDDHSVDPRLVLAALRRACEAAGVRAARARAASRASSWTAWARAAGSRA